MPEPEPYEPARADRQRAGRPPGGDRAPRRRTGSSASCNEISDEQAREDLGRLSAQMMAIVARSARVADGDDGLRSRRGRRAGQDRCREVPPPVARRGRSAPRQGDRHVLDLHRRARAERVDVHRAHRASTGADCGAALSAAVGDALRPAARRRARVRHADDRRGRGDGRPGELGSRTRSTRGKRIMGFGHRVYRAEDPRVAHPEADRARARLAAGRDRRALEEVALAELERRHPERVAGDERRVLLRARPRRRRDPAAAGARDVRVLACRRLVGAHPRAEADGRLFRPSARYVGPGPRSLSSLDEPRRGGDAGGRARAGGRRALARDAAGAVGRGDRGGGPRQRLPRARAGLPRDRPVPVSPEAPAPAAWARGREPGGARVGADRARRALARTSRATSTRFGRCCTSSPRAIRTSRCAASPSSA